MAPNYIFDMLKSLPFIYKFLHVGFALRSSILCEHTLPSDRAISDRAYFANIALPSDPTLFTGGAGRAAAAAPPSSTELHLQQPSFVPSSRASCPATQLCLQQPNSVSSSLAPHICPSLHFSGFDGTLEGFT
ncbi:hypothetical protein SLEP1_g12343 [Rubroshorea leprosula]|uniref:Uncharacterized protein n=1 Tax=Rubroshorea leprosula TaxID=152421 RepID=A0AAV5INK8_9ROSI|nr:hypothetical protein SLEP1_g12343 [Rubroshorea leprosula]